MRGERNKAIVRRFWEQVFNGGDLDAVDQLFASSHVLHEPGLPQARGPESMKGFVRMFRRASPDVRVVVEDEVAEGDTVVSHWTAHGVLADELRNIVTTGDELTVSGISIFRLSAERIAATHQLLEAHVALTPPQAARDWLLAEQSISDLAVDDDGQQALGWFCRICGCCRVSGDHPTE